MAIDKFRAWSSILSGFSIKKMRKPPAHPTVLRNQGLTIKLPKPVLIIDSMEQKGYTFKSFQNWFAGIERRKLHFGDYSIAGLDVAQAKKEMEPLITNVDTLSVCPENSLGIS